LRNHSEDLRIFFIHSQDADSAFFIFDFKIFCSRTDEYLPNLPRCTIILSENCCSILTVGIQDTLVSEARLYASIPMDAPETTGES